MYWSLSFLGEKTDIVLKKRYTQIHVETEINSDYIREMNDSMTSAFL